MNIKTYLKIFLLIILVSIGISTVYSQGTNLNDIQGTEFYFSNDSSHMSLNDRNLTLENITFNVPEGFEEDKKTTKLDLKSNNPNLEGLRGSRCTFVKDNDYITYMVIYSELSDFKFSDMTPLEGYDSNYKTISNKEGIFTFMNDTYSFTYSTDNGYVQIESNNENLISQALI